MRLSPRKAIEYICHTRLKWKWSSKIRCLCNKHSPAEERRLGTNLGNDVVHTRGDNQGCKSNASNSQHYMALSTDSQQKKRENTLVMGFWLDNVTHFHGVLDTEIVDGPRVVVVYLRDRLEAPKIALHLNCTTPAWVQCKKSMLTLFDTNTLPWRASSCRRPSCASHH